MGSPGEPGCVGSPFVFHSCAFDECEAEYADPEYEVVHIPWWEKIRDDAAMSIVVDWHARESEVEWPEWLFGAMPDELETRWLGQGPHPPARGPADGRGRWLLPAAGAELPPGSAPRWLSGVRPRRSSRRPRPPARGLPRGRWASASVRTAAALEHPAAWLGCS